MRISQKAFPLGVVALIIATIFAYLIWEDIFLFTLFPFGLMAIYFAIYQTEKLFLAIAFFTPLSFNIEELSQSFGLFIPSEPLLFGLMLFLSAVQIKSPFLDNKIWKHPIILSVAFYVFWMFFTSLTSTHPLISFKFLISKLWFIIPVLVFGTHFFKKEKNRLAFFWLFLLAVIITVIYTLLHHAQYDFREKEGHWVMFPFFKDHTIYGAIIAMVLPLSIMLFLYKKHSPLKQLVLMVIISIILVGIYFSYTRAAWLSLFIALVVSLIIYYRINFKFLLAMAMISLFLVLINWDRIEMELARVKYEHTTDSFDERLQSAANVTTDASNLERINRWSCAIEMFKKRPIFGYGPGTYAFEYAPFQEPENLTIISTNFGDMGNAHSEYLGALSEMGIIGLFAFLAILISVYYTGIKCYYSFSKSERRNKVFVMGIIFALTTYFSHAFLNNYLDTDKAAVPIWGMCAMLLVWSLGLDESKSPANPK